MSNYPRKCEKCLESKGVFYFRLCCLMNGRCGYTNYQCDSCIGPTLINFVDGGTKYFIRGFCIYNVVNNPGN